MSDRHRGAQSEERLRALEARLAGTLRPVAPPQELLQRLRGRIHFPDRSQIADRLRNWRRLMLVLGGVISGAVVVLTLVRALYHMVGRRDVG
jgi:hypothetical protein